MKTFGALIASAAIACGASGAHAQSVATSAAVPVNAGLPPGLVRQGGVVMMQPIADSEERSSGATVFAGERRTGLVRYLSPSDHDIFNRAIEAGKRGDWAAARALSDQGRDPLARLIMEWAYLLQKNGGAPFAEIAAFLKANPQWPARDTLLIRAEQAMEPIMDPRAVIAWFAGRDPQTGIGKIRLGEALIATGAPSPGRALIRRAWIEDSFEPDKESYVIARHGDILTPELDHERLERLLARDEISAARRELGRLSPEVRRVATARLDLRDHPALGEREAHDLPPPLRDDPGLLWDEIGLLRQRNDMAAISAILARIPASEIVAWNPSHWWAQANLDARAALRLGFDRTAYQIVAAAALPRESLEYSDAEFLAGWIALRRLHDPQAALAHFQNLTGLAERPVSRARAHYWAARAFEALGETPAASQEYRAAATDAPTFYGELALARMSSAPALHLETTQADASALAASYEHEEMTEAIRALADLGLEGPLREFAIKDAELHPDAAHMKLMAQDLTRMGFREIAVRVAKVASYGGIRLYEYSHPLISLPRYAGLEIAPENALVLAIIRQETEFDPAAISGAGALGLMQVMPDAARHTAEKTGLIYRPADLTADATYNMELGTAELAHDLSVWDGSYVLAAAAYNAGLGNVHKWVVAFGDPRDPRVDPVDWIEEIPFSETRNYVQRVLENVEVYRNRLAGRDGPLRILSDLHRPYVPQLPPQTPVPIGNAAAAVSPAPSPAPQSQRVR